MNNRMPMKAWKVFLLTLLALAVLFAIALPIFSQKIEQAVEVEMDELLRDDFGGWVSYKVDGRNVFLDGEAPNAQERDHVETIVRSTAAVSDVHSNISVVVKETRKPYVMNAQYDGSIVTLSGFTETESDKIELLAQVNTAFGTQPVVEDIEIYAGAPEGWLASTGTAIMQLARLGKGKLEIDGNAIRLQGDVDGKAVAESVRQELEAVSKENYLLDFDLMVRAPTIVEEVVSTFNCQREFDVLLARDSIHFKTGRTSISTKSFGLLEKLLDVIGECPESHVEVGGYTDSRGGAARNAVLSLDRAASVVKWLVGKGVSRDQLTAIGYGEKNPVASNRTEQGRALNRRIEFTIRGE